MNYSEESTPIQNDPKEPGAITDRDLRITTWGLLFVWVGVRNLLVFLPEGTGLVGIALILFGLNAVRKLRGFPTNPGTNTLGIFILVWGGVELGKAASILPDGLPSLPVLLVLAGIMLLARELTRDRTRHAAV